MRDNPTSIVSLHDPQFLTMYVCPNHNNSFDNREGDRGIAGVLLILVTRYAVDFDFTLKPDLAV